MTTASLSRRMLRMKVPKDEGRQKGRPEVIPQEARVKLRTCYAEHMGQWGPSVLACWARREGIGAWSSETIAKVIADLKPEPEQAQRPQKYEIAGPMVMWSEDGTGFVTNAQKKELMVLQDEYARFKVNTRLAEGPACEADVLSYLEEAFEKHGAPLVLKHDNAKYQNTDAVQKLCERFGVIILNSPPRYPAYNGRCERSMRDIKGYVRALSRHHRGKTLQERISLTIKDLNEERPRPVLGGRTAKEAFETLRMALPDRKQFQIRVRTRQIELEEKARDRNEKHAARRRAVEEVLSDYGLLKWKGDTSTDLNAETRTS